VVAGSLKKKDLDEVIRLAGEAGITVVARPGQASVGKGPLGD
jgi:hypothetical protein